ncbi:PIG-L deacetylase family protein [Gordonia sp. (in: high G+C Gram-positive bacteria)]|uniref:PIG-L deacetylase family protein n=1 Tax=Gordonia sp. (in: high G+C Gram-positive bacteria) TaxID=84139 RepID=UPI0039E3E2E0
MATVVVFHAHPDDEVILTGGTIARLAAEGHRVVVVVATDGKVEGPEPHPVDDADRIAELRASAAELGAHRVEALGYADSGHGPEFYPDPPGRVRFARADTEQAAGRLAEILRDERADVLLSYEANGGYGHRDHVKVHPVGERAAELAGTPRVLYATMPRETLMRGLRRSQRLHLPYIYGPDVVPTAYSPEATITHRIDVRPYARVKKRAALCHASQVPGAARFVPTALFRIVGGREWFVERGVEPGGEPKDWLF